MIINGHDVHKKVFIVAEAGVNHEGSIKEAKRLIESAKEADADAIKFQTYIPEKYIAVSEKNRFDRVKRFALSFDEFGELKTYAARVGIMFFSTPLDEESVDFLTKISSVIKISSGDLNYKPLVERIALKKKPIIFSTGSASLRDIRRTLNWIVDKTSSQFVMKNVAALHCVSAYPVPVTCANLASIPFLKQKLAITIGYSDHTQGIETAALAVASGARIIEKHFTRSRTNRTFHDHFLSATPTEFKRMVNNIRRIEVILGKEEKRISPIEREKLPYLRRGVASKLFLKKGNKIQVADLMYVRPEGDFPYSKWRSVIGKELKKDVNQGQLIRRTDVR